MCFSNAGQDEFTERDVEVFKRYLTFAGIGEFFKMQRLEFPAISLLNLLLKANIISRANKNTPTSQNST